MNKKIIALLLATALTTGMGGFGTYAYFFEKDEIGSNVNIAMGTLNTESNWTGYWTNESVGEEVSMEEKAYDLNASNVKPGDIFKRTFSVSNVGTLKSNVKIKLMDTFAYGFDVEMKILSTRFEKDLEIVDNCIYVNEFEVQDNIQLELTVKVREDLDVSWMNTGGHFIHNFIEVESEQLKRS